ncbi:transcription termination factor 2, mitochondrial-like [Mugil cephalus]|uniref:transcription termination factor 2, mitochondrial-like n=1 Tax=Mugil cephalus TaxID=48193 RepID=UPI001FB635F9|nr:transcription termination factor 2, mitochondrial-like [Mugil cephalus]XP_047430843.1 transcription termination factor 2, mitochondrial-like [Mugil cephalus]XP_047430845.1 transcription termination factor 2, mitochondrial-like [Mugil cephalus]
MLRVTTASLCTSCQRVRLLLLPPSASTSTVTPSNKRLENQRTVDSLYDLSVDVRKVRKFKGWVLSESSAYVSETAALLRDMGADGTVIARILETHPEAVLCRPEDVAAQRGLWESVCPNKRELVGIIEKFPASFFTLTHHGNQQANILYLQSLHLNKRIISKLIASAPQSFSRPVERNQEVIHTLRETYLDLGGEEGNLRVWLQKLLSQNPYILLRPAEAWRDSLGFLREQGFTTEELLSLVSSLRASIAELKPEAMRQALAYIEGALACSKDELKQVAIRCPAVLYYSLPTLVSRYQGLMDVGVSMEQVKESPNVMELTTQIVLYRVQKLASYGYDVRSGSLDVIVGTKKDFEMTYGKLSLRQQRPLFNPVAPLKSEE